jgi:hypothetical protein
MINASFVGDGFALGEFAAQLEACKSPLATEDFLAECVQALVFTDAHCAPSATDHHIICVIGGVHVQASAFSFYCDEGVGCPSTDPTFAAKLALVDQESCVSRAVIGFEGSCFPSARCQWLSETSVLSFGPFCPSVDGEFCCASGMTKTTNYFSGDFLFKPIDSSESILSHVVDTSFRVFFDVSPPSLVRITVETPYVTSTSSMLSIKNGQSTQSKMCPSAYLFDFQDPVESMPPVTIGVPRRTNLQSDWMPLRYFPADDLVGKPRSACANHDFNYTSSDDFRSKFVFPDINVDSLAYGATPSVDATVWNATVALNNIPSGSETFWTMAAPVGGRVNYSTGTWDLVTGFYGCKDYQTGNRLVQKRTEDDAAQFMGVSYAVDSYNWNMHLCQVGYFGKDCENASKLQHYAKACNIVPVKFTVAPQQMAGVSTQSLSTSITSKTFLQRVDSITSDCGRGNERLAIVMHLAVFDDNLDLIFDEVVHRFSPKSVFRNNDNLQSVSNATAFHLPADFLASRPTVEGIYALEARRIITAEGVVLQRKIVVLTKCYFTGYDVRLSKRTVPAAFANTVADSFGVVSLELNLVLRRIQGIEVNTLQARVIASKNTFMLSSIIELVNVASDVSHALYDSYEAARDDVGSLETDALSGRLLTAGDQLCSKHRLLNAHAQASVLTPNALGACVITTVGLARTDGDGTLLAGNQVRYQAAFMIRPAIYTFGCERTWIDLSQIRPNSDGLYVFSRLLRLPDDNHDQTYWLVTQGQLNKMKMGTSNTSQADFFGVGVFRYDSNANMNIAAKSIQMQLDTTTRLANKEELTAGCTETLGTLRASCNLVCFTIVHGHLTREEPGSNATLMIHHISVAEVSNEIQVESVDRFKRRLLQEKTSTRELARLLTIRASENTNTVDNTQYTAQAQGRSPQINVAAMRALVAVGCIAGIGILVGICYWVRICYSPRKRKYPYYSI